jgi:hypothetical protein
MNSPEKLIAFLEQLDDCEDAELSQILPVPPNWARMGIAAASNRVPDDAEQLDAWALSAAQFCLSMRSDSAQAYTLSEHDETVGELAAAGGTHG